MRNIIEFLFAHRLQLFAARLEFLVDLDGLLGHLLVRIRGAADQHEIIAFGDAFMAIGIEADAEQRGLAFIFFGVCHRLRLKLTTNAVKAMTSPSFR